MEVRVPVFPESITEGTIIAWNKQPGDTVQVGDIIAEIETDKVVFEVPAPIEGTIKELLINVDDPVNSDQVVATIEEGEISSSVSETTPANAPSKPVPADPPQTVDSVSQSQGDAQTSPAVRKILAEKQLSKEQVPGTGKNGRITKADALQSSAPTISEDPSPASAGLEQRVPMSRIRKRIAERLLQSSQSTAMLTTFNEVNMQPIMDARARYKELFEKKHDVRLGFMSFFVKAITQTLLLHPDVNASIDEDDLIYHGYCDVGIAVSTERGLVVPILRQAENLSFSEIEKKINFFANQAKNNKLSIDDLIGGTFSITNGGVFGSLMSTPIINPPQSAILGMHAIKQRPVAENNQVVIRPMMYLALSYDHRIIDGKTSVTFLKDLKEILEDPIRLVMDV